MQLCKRCGAKLPLIRRPDFARGQMFVGAIDWILQDLAAKDNHTSPGTMAGLGLSGVACCDDLIAWATGKKHLSECTARLVQELHAWGLRVNIAKCQAYVSPYSSITPRMGISGLPGSGCHRCGTFHPNSLYHTIMLLYTQEEHVSCQCTFGSRLHEEREKVNSLCECSEGSFLTW